MKKVFALCAALLVSGLFASAASAQAPPGMMQSGPSGGASPYGWHPKLQQLALSHSAAKCGKPSLLGRLFGKSNGGYGQGVENGTLVFPNNPFTRSPRDFFMLDQ
jgi:hypothetical protein